MNSLSTPYYKLLDFTVMLLASVVSYWVRFHDPELPLNYLIPAVFFSVIATYTLSASKFYDSTNSQFSINRVIAALSGLGFAAILTATCLYLTKTGEEYSRLWFVMTLVLSFFSLILIRAFLFKFFKVSMGTRIVVLIGSNKTALAVVNRLANSSAEGQGLKLSKHFEVNISSSDLKQTLNDVLRFVEKSRVSSIPESLVSEIWLTSDVFTNYPIAELELLLASSSATIVYVPEIPVLEGFDFGQFDTVAGIPTINSGFRKSQKLNTAIKLIEDKFIALVLLILLAPLLILIAALIKTSSNGPVLFKQIRNGFSGGEFEIFKFRTMYSIDADQVFSQAKKNDRRITPIGLWLRKLSLDELPQLFNVLNGTMSMVGPRPHPVELNNDYRYSIDRYMARHAVKPGITGLAQIKGFRGETATPESMENRIHYDLEYVRSWSVFLDLKIILLTFVHVFTTDKAY